MTSHPPRPATAVLLPLLAVLVLGSAPRALAIPDHDELEVTNGPERIDLLLGFGLETEAERLLRESLEEGRDGEWARAPLVSLLLRQGRAVEAGDLVEKWGGPGGIGGETSFFLAGRVRAAEGKWAEAAAAFGASAAREPLLADHASFQAGLAHRALDDPEEALAHFEAAGGAARGSELSARSHWAAAEICAETGQAERALSNLEQIPPRSVIPREDLLALTARVHGVLGDDVREAAVLRELFERVPSSEAAMAALERLAQLDPLDVDDRLALAEAAVERRHWALGGSQARAALGMLEGHSDPVREGRARLALGKSLLGRRHLTKARRELDKMPDGARLEDRAEALLDRARCLWKLGQIDACLAEYDVVATSEYPDEQREAAAWEAAREAKDAARWREAAIRLEEFQRTFPEGEYADDALWHAGRARVEIDEPDEAIRLFHLLQNRYPDSWHLEESIYWTANLLRDSGDEAAACAELTRLLVDYPDSYWTGRVRETEATESCPPDSTRAAAAERDPFEWLAELFPDVDSGASLATATSIRHSESFRRAAALAGCGLVTEAEEELVRLRRSLARDPVALLALADAAWRIGTPRVAMRAMTMLKERTGAPILSDETPRRVARLLYPLEHLDSVLRWTAEYEVDPFFVYAVMREESWFDPQAVSWAGAHGLLQIMPSTGRDLARRVGLPRFERTDLFVPDVNIRLGSYYLSSLLDELDREPTVALSAYNAGKRNALRWKRGFDGDDFDADRYVAGITYRETYWYVQRVSRSWAIYRHLYGDLVSTLKERGEAAEATSP